MKVEEIEGGNDIKEAFGIYNLFSKAEFIDSFDKHMQVYRFLGAALRESLNEHKINEVYRFIDESFIKNKDKEISIKDASLKLPDLIEENKEYYLIYSYSDLPRLAELDKKAIKMEGSVYEWDIKKSKIYLIPPGDVKNILLFEKDTFTLQQYQQGYKKINEPLVVQVEELDKNDIKEVLKNNKKFKSEEDVKEKVKIRISEKFKVKRNKGLLIRLKRVDN